MNIPTPDQSLIGDLIGEYSRRLAASLEMLTGETVQTTRCAEPSLADEGDPEALPWLWNSYQLSTTPPSTIWTGATAMVSNAIGTKVLLAAGINEISTNDVQGSYAEVQQGAISALVQWLEKQLGEDLSLHPVETVGSPPPVGRRYLLRVTVGKEQLDGMCVALPDSFDALLQKLAPTQDSRSNAKSAEVLEEKRATKTDSVHIETKAPVAGQRSQAMERILDFELPMTVSFGKARLPLREVLCLSTGSIVELDRSIGDPVEIIVNERIVGRGEVVVVEGNYGIRIQELMVHAR